MILNPKPQNPASLGLGLYKFAYITGSVLRTLIYMGFRV